MKTKLMAAVLLSSCAGIAQAQTCPNSCVAAVSGVKEGVHTQFATGYDAILWPPNHKFRTVGISARNKQNDECNVTITDVTQDEPVTGEALGAGNTTPDAQACSNAGNASSVDLRGERAGTSMTGRFYTVSYTMEDPDCALPSGTKTATILVPHDQGLHLGTGGPTYVNEGGTFQSDDTATPGIACN